MDERSRPISINTLSHNIPHGLKIQRGLDKRSILGENASQHPTTNELLAEYFAILSNHDNISSSVRNTRLLAPFGSATTTSAGGTTKVPTSVTVEYINIIRQLQTQMHLSTLTLMVSDNAVDLALIRSEALYCLQPVNLFETENGRHAGIKSKLKHGPSVHGEETETPPTRPLTHGDVRRIYAELLAERDAAKPPTLSRRVGKFVRRMRGVKDSQPVEQGSHIRARTQPYPVRRSTPPMPEEDQINVAGPDMLEAAMRGCQKAPVTSAQPMPTLNVGEYGNVVRFAEPVPEEGDEEYEAPAIAITSPSIEMTPDQPPVPEATSVQEADPDISSSSLVPTELVEVPRRRKKRSASVLEAITLPPALRSSSTLESTEQLSTLAPSESNVKQNLPTIDDMVDVLGWDRALELIQQEKHNEPTSLRSTARFRAPGGENIPPGFDTPLYVDPGSK
ncbi:RNA polymerase III subunit C82 [Malassezia brasiliensis]|uniref:RNA polymerase III subunit C82 n=1 Tax=Malassezia brasiliensis TaxID=1821822 RepID=A0AAF0IPL4_9BASI|nr:RNA polymerase III subunit C82 [Malassezia brasiliensis]